MLTIERLAEGQSPPVSARPGLGLLLGDGVAALVASILLFVAGVRRAPVGVPVPAR